MPLTPGTRLGPYEVTAQIGEGGMGEVYRATDSNLKRQVAIKVLPASVAGDADRLARFQREAEVLAALNHPNIAQIYGMEDGPAEAGHHIGTNVASGFSRTVALVMELVEGEDLSQRIARLRAPGASARQAGMPLDEALPIAKQIAEALEAAHEQGIIHRDLKPANIKVRPDGTVKVLDFGLAKAMGPPEGDGFSRRQAEAEASALQITTPAMTQAGMILGTAAYMAPEQARGKAVDRRADIWAFGVVLFEMLAGKRPFDGEDMTEVLGAVVRLEPVWEALPPTLPARVSQALRLCLRKDPKQRVGDIRDVRLALEGAFETAAPPATTVPTSAAAAPRLPWTVAGIAVAIAVALSAFLYVRSARPAAEAQTIRFEVETPSAGAPTAISPDGRHLVTLATRGGATGLWVRSLDQVDSQVLKGTERAGGAGFWSPDSLSIAFFADGKLKKVDLRGTPPKHCVRHLTRIAAALGIAMA